MADERERVHGSYCSCFQNPGNGLVGWFFALLLVNTIDFLLQLLPWLHNEGKGSSRDMISAYAHSRLSCQMILPLIRFTLGRIPWWCQ